MTTPSRKRWPHSEWAEGTTRTTNWWVTNTTRTGDAISVAAFDKDGNLILQIFPYRKDTPPDAWNAMAAALPGVSA